MSGMAARCAGNDLQRRRKIDQVVYESRVQLAAIFNELADQAGEPPLTHALTTDNKKMTKPMTDEEARQQVERTDAFIAAFRELIASTVVDPASPCEVVCHRGLERIAATVDAVDYVTYANLANLNTALRGRLLEIGRASCRER